jgi:hypothetical protein
VGDIYFGGHGSTEPKYEDVDNPDLDDYEAAQGPAQGHDDDTDEEVDVWVDDDDDDLELDDE